MISWSRNILGWFGVTFLARIADLYRLWPLCQPYSCAHESHLFQDVVCQAIGFENVLTLLQKYAVLKTL